MKITKDFIINIVTYNRYDYLDELIKSIVEQTIWPKEIYISDNGIGYKLKEKYDIPINIIKNSYNYGTCRSTNQLIKLNKNCDALFLCDDNYFINKNSLESIISKFDKEKLNNIHLIWCNHWASFIASKEWINTIGLFDDNIWPCYYEDSDMTERIRKQRTSTILHNCIGYPPVRFINNFEETEVIGNKRGTGEVLIAKKYNDFKIRNLYYHNYKWKEKILNSGDLHENTHQHNVNQEDINIEDFEIQYLKNKIKDLSFENEYNWVSEFVDEILQLKELNLETIIEYKTQRTYMSRLLLILNPKEFTTYDDEFNFSHDFCYHFNYLLKSKSTVKVLNTKEISKTNCDLLVINKSCDINILNLIEAKYLVVFSNNTIQIPNYNIVKRLDGKYITMFLYKNNT